MCGEGACSRWAAQRPQKLAGAAHPSGSKLPRHNQVHLAFRTPSPGSSRRRAPSPCWPAGRCNRSSPAHPCSMPG
ncbi:hypothetical protein CQ006_13230 [Pseudomonas cedrina]|uniref:Uncharacterized protein n=1 Tax=Pseudomonas cedrina TaxID=651740 RepID=A0A2S9DQX6_PSECE|nr:hypothetical protein CQ006_13230 [Pseudomonas cedrina]